MKSLLIILISLFFHFDLYGQVDSTEQLTWVDSVFANQEKWLHRRFGSPYDFPYDYDGVHKITESTISLVPEFQIGQQPYFSLSITKDFYELFRKGVWTGNNFGLGLEYNFQHKVFAPKISCSRYILLFNYRINALYYMTSEKNYPAFRPEIGLGIYRVHLSFGRNIFFEEMDLNMINKWNVSAYYYLPVLPRKY